MLPPLVVHTCNETKAFKKTGTFTITTFSTPPGGETVPSVDMWITHRSKGWLDSQMMCVWLQHVYGQGVAMFGVRTDDTVLFMDGCSAHHTQECEDMARGLGIQVECLPPNCTPILQPCDQYVNALFKQYYHDEWFEWYKQFGSKQHTKKGNKHSRLRRATEVEVQPVDRQRYCTVDREQSSYTSKLARYATEPAPSVTTARQCMDSFWSGTAVQSRSLP